MSIRNLSFTDCICFCCSVKYPVVVRSIAYFVFGIAVSFVLSCESSCLLKNVLNISDSVVSIWKL